MSEEKYDLKIREIELPQKVQKVLRKGLDSKDTKAPLEDPFFQYYDKKIIEPPHDLYMLSSLQEYSTILGPCLDAMTVNISGLGYRVVPRDEKESNDLADEIRTDIAKLKTFYETAYLEGTFTQLKKLLRKDLEATGNSFMEVLPSMGDDMVPVGMKHIQSWNMRVCVADTYLTSYMVPRIVKNESENWEIRWIPDRKQFRRFAYKTQYSNKVIYFKEWGDPRVISYEDGEVLAPDWKSATPEQRGMAANPIIHQKIYCPRSPYGLPRYIGNILTMNGCRAAEEVNYITLKCNNMPAMMLLVTNAAITDASVDRIREFIEHRVQGDQNYSTILVVEAEPVTEGMKDPGTMKMDLNPLTQNQHTDAMFVQYMEGCEERVRQAYRLPPILIGRCVPIETEFLTENGWKKYRDISDDEKLGTFNMNNEEIEYQVPLKRYEYDYKGDMYKVHDVEESLDFECTPNHKMIYQTCKDGWRINEFQDLVNMESVVDDFCLPVPCEPYEYNKYCEWEEYGAHCYEWIDSSYISTYEYDGKICCFTTPNGTIITRNNGSLPIISHNSDDYTRSTADSSKKVAEEQVFAPEREDEDDVQNIKIVPYLGIVHAVIKSNTPDVTDNYELTQLLAVAERSGGLSPYISRFIVEDVLGKDLPDIDESIPNNIPFTMTMLREQLNAQAAIQGANLESDKEVVDQLKSIKNLMVQQNVGTEEYYSRMDRVIKLMEMTQPEISVVPIIDIKKESKTETIQVARKAGEERVVIGAVLVPGQTDLQGEIYDADVVTKAAHYWLEKYQENRQENGLKLMHSGNVLTTLKPYESYVLTEDKTFEVDIAIADDDHPVKEIKSITYPKGTWIMMAKIYDDDIWKGIKKGDYLGYSIGGVASVVEIKNLS